MFCIKLDLISELNFKKMKSTAKKLITAAGVTAVMLSATSCNIEPFHLGNFYVPNAVVTVKPLTGGSIPFYLQIDDSTTAVADNIHTAPYGNREVRAIAQLEELHKSVEGYDKVYHVHYLDSILTKDILPFTNHMDVDTLYGNDPVILLNDWKTAVEDGYLTLEFQVMTPSPYAAHRINLLSGINPDDPYELEFRHMNDYHGYIGDEYLANGLAAFRLDSLPDTEGKTVKITVRWLDPDGRKKAFAFDYCTGVSSPEKLQLRNGVTYLDNLK